MSDNDATTTWRDACPLKAWRVRTGKSRMFVAIDVGVSIGIVNEWEAGRCWPKWDNFVLMAQMMGRDPVRLETAFREWWIQDPNTKEVKT